MTEIGKKPLTPTLSQRERGKQGTVYAYSFVNLLMSGWNAFT